MNTLELKLDAFNKINLFDSSECEEKSWVDNVLEKCHQLHQRIYMEKGKNVKESYILTKLFLTLHSFKVISTTLVGDRWVKYWFNSLYYPSNSV